MVRTCFWPLCSVIFANQTGEDMYAGCWRQDGCLAGTSESGPEMTCRKPRKQSAGAQAATIAAAVVMFALLATCLVALRREPSLLCITRMLGSLSMHCARMHAACE